MTRRVTKILWSLTLAGTALAALGSPVLAQEDSVSIAYYVGKSVRHHPDGAVGVVSFHGLFQYALVTRFPKGLETDFQNYEGELGWVIGDHLNLKARFLTTADDSLRYELKGHLQVYFSNPVNTDRRKNPDGVVGSPVLTLGGGIRYPDLAISDTRAVGDLSLLVPLSHRLSLLAGYRYYEEIEPFDVHQSYGGLNLYLAAYPADSAYANPDGPVGNLAIQLSGGRSTNGVFGDLMLLFPISNSLTWRLNFRGERTDLTYRRSAIAGAGFSFYPSN